MPAVAITILIAFFVIGCALAALGIGLLLTGKPKIKPGACGRDPNKVRDKECGTEANCMLCEKHGHKPLNQEGFSNPQDTKCSTTEK